MVAGFEPAYATTAGRSDSGAVGGCVVAAVGVGSAVRRFRAAAWKASSGEMVPMDGSWQAVAASSDVVADGVMHPFEHGSLIGFVPRADCQPEAVSGICTHQGCRLYSTHRATGRAARAIRPRSRPPVSCRSTDTAAPVTGS